MTMQIGETASSRLPSMLGGADARNKDGDELICLVHQRSKHDFVDDAHFVQDFEPEKAFLGLFQYNAQFGDEFCL